MRLLDTQPINVFLVNDHKLVLWGLERLIASAAPRMRVSGTAGSCDELLAKLASGAPDVIVLDLESGGASLACLEKLAANPTLRVLVLTGATDRELHQQAAVRGARGVVPKQADADVLLRAIYKVHEGEVWLDRGILGRVFSTLAHTRNNPPEAKKIDKLTCKERQIVATLVKAKGARNKIIADKLHISEHTLRNHFTTIYDKLQVSGRLELYLLASSELRDEGEQLIAA
ncbi:MAG: response regulator transcription factor [Betaproteobacteria bacterium]|nr:response regulator transcription factor [Betaproteobacteria bacterium]